MLKTQNATLETKVNGLENKISHSTYLIHNNQYNIEKQNLESKIGDVNKKYHTLVD